MAEGSNYISPGCAKDSEMQGNQEGPKLDRYPSMWDLAGEGNVHSDALIQASYAQARASIGEYVRKVVESKTPFKEADPNNSDEIPGVHDKTELDPLPLTSYDDEDSIELASSRDIVDIVDTNGIVQAFNRKNSEAFRLWAAGKISPIMNKVSKSTEPLEPSVQERIVELTKIASSSNETQGANAFGKKRDKVVFGLPFIPVDRDLEAFEEKYPSGSLLNISKDGFVISVIVQSHRKEGKDLVIKAVWLNDSNQIKPVKIYASKLKPLNVDLLRNAVKDPFDLKEVEKLLEMKFQETLEREKLKLERRSLMEQRVDASMANEDSESEIDEFEIDLDLQK